MASYACPSCGAPIEFGSSFSVYAVCRSCGSTVLRTDRDVSLIGKQADLPDEIGPLQVGSAFSVRGQAYRLLGRVRMGWADGAWNEWFIDGGTRKGWLAEAQGFLALSFEVVAPPALPGEPAPALGDRVQVDGQWFRVTDVKQATCLGAEGELPFPAARGRSATYYDMLDATGGFAGIEQSDEGRRQYVGAYLDFDELGFTGLREVEGWTVPQSQPTAEDPFLRPR